MKIYFDVNNDESRGYTLKSWREIMKDEELDEIVLTPGIYETGSDYFYCLDIRDCLEKDDNTCGKLNCNEYEPRNGKSGICKHFKNTYTLDEDKKFILRAGHKKLIPIK